MLETFSRIKFHQEATQGQEFFFLISLPLAVYKKNLCNKKTQYI